MIAAFNGAWYCARTKPKHEHIAAANLSRNLGLEVFNPRLRIERATRRGVVRSIEPLFPCYIFVNCANDSLSDIRYVNGVSSIVHFGLGIPTVPD
jgi:transcriptional antiterminator RfaH